jgi:hypothetical protein
MSKIIGTLLIILLALGVGAAAGLYIAWIVAPVTYTDTAPHSLRTDFKDQYRYMISAAYLASGDLGRAQTRLSLLHDANSAQALAMQAQRMSASGAPLNEALPLSVLADALQGLSEQPTATLTLIPTLEIPATATPSQTPDPLRTVTLTPRPAQTQSPTPEPSPTITRTPIATVTPRPTRTPTATPGAPYALQSQETICDAARPGLLRIYVRDAARQPVAGVPMVIAWGSVQETFFTGFKNEIDPGYADFSMLADVEYSLQVGLGGEIFTGLRAPACPGGVIGGLLLRFEQ